MYSSYSLRIVVFVLVIFYSLCVDCSEVTRTNCSSYQQVFKENLRNCVDGAEGLDDGGFSENITQTMDNNSSLEPNENPNIPNDPQNSWEIELTNGTGLSIQKNQDDITFKITKLSTSMEARKQKMKVMDIIPYLIIPGFISAGVLPWLIPGMKLAVMGVAMINQMAFTSSLFSLIRGYIFDTSQEDHIVYVNHGYEKYKYKNQLHSHR